MLTCGRRPQLDWSQLTDGDQLKEAPVRPSQVLQGLYLLASRGCRRSRLDGEHQQLRALEWEGDGRDHSAT